MLSLSQPAPQRTEIVMLFRIEAQQRTTLVHLRGEIQENADGVLVARASVVCRCGGLQLQGARDLQLSRRRRLGALLQERD